MNPVSSLLEKIAPWKMSEKAFAITDGYQKTITRSSLKEKIHILTSCSSQMLLGV